MDLPFKVCPQCGVEHVHTAQVCGDCGVALEVSDARQPAASPLPPAAELQKIAAGGPWEMERLALELQRAGISCRIDGVAPSSPSDRSASHTSQRGAASSGARLALYVLPAEAAPAERVLREAMFPEEADAVESSAPGVELDACPACEATIAEGATACTDCGLEFVAVDDLCARCGAVLLASHAVCPACGAGTRRDG